MYLVTETRRKTKTWWKWLCEVFYVSNLKTRPSDITEEIANRFGFEYKKWYIVVPYWSGTWYMRISEAIRKDHSKSVVFAISAFKN